MNGITKEEAIAEMLKGNKVTHKYFSANEWMTHTADGRILLEDGVKCLPSEFWRWRADESWNSGYSLYVDK